VKATEIEVLTGLFLSKVWPSFANRGLGAFLITLIQVVHHHGCATAGLLDSLLFALAQARRDAEGERLIPLWS
jgi:hypothetical protein